MGIMPLINLKKDEYDSLKELGMLFERYPEATGDFDEDVTKPYKKFIEDLDARTREIHRVWHKFNKWLRKSFGNDLYGEPIKNKFKIDGKTKTIKTYPFNEMEFQKRLCGYEVIERIEKYVKKQCPEIKIVNCDDNVHAGSILLLIPHPNHGITIMFIPQCTYTQNIFFLYDNHHKMLNEELNKMKYVYKHEHGS